MSRPTKLSDIDIADALTGLHPDWKLVNGKLHRRLAFSSFAAAFGFMARIAIEAEALAHHPNWSNVYTRVDIDLVTHDVSGLTKLDFLLAEAIDSAAATAPRIS